VRIDCVYGRKEAHEVLRRSMVDYRNKFGTPEGRLQDLQRMLLEALTPARAATQRPRAKHR